MKKIAIIPARMGSSRFPGKPLADICGIPMLGHVYTRTNESSLLDRTYIATCDNEIKNYADSINAPCIMTSDAHERCTDRTAEALLKIEDQMGEKVDIIVMVQGDEPMITGGMVDDSIRVMENDPSIKVVNLMSKIQTEKEFDDPNEVKVVFDNDLNALYFSREAIPSRRMGSNFISVYKQVCLIPFRRDFLLQFNEMEQTPLEKIESVDMMRVLENGWRVKMVLTDEVTYSVDTLEDINKVRFLMQKSDVTV